MTFRFLVTASFAALTLTTPSYAQTNPVTPRSELGKQAIYQMSSMGVKMALLGEQDTYIVPDIDNISLAEFRNVAVLDFSEIALYQLPSWIGELGDLRVLDLSNTKLKESELSKLAAFPKLEDLKIGGNPALIGSDVLADNISSLVELRTLDVSGNGWTDSNIGDLGKLRNLTDLNISGNKIKNVAALGLNDLLLKSFIARDNQIGNLEDESIPSNGLEHLDLTGNNINVLPYLDFPELRTLKVDDRTRLSAEYEGLFSVPKLVQVEVNPEFISPVFRCKVRTNGGNPCGLKNGVRPKMVYIEGGIYSAPNRVGLDCMDSKVSCEGSVSRNVEAFYISAYELTVGDWRACTKAGGCKDRYHISTDDRLPVSADMVDISRYLDWIEIETGHSYRLPTDIEWAHAAYPGITTKLSEYGWLRANSRDDKSNFYVGMKKANTNGLYDVIGNVSELVRLDLPSSRRANCSLYNSYSSENDAIEVPHEIVNSDLAFKNYYLNRSFSDGVAKQVFYHECEPYGVIGGSTNDSSQQTKFSRMSYAFSSQGKSYVGFSPDSLSGKYEPYAYESTRVGFRLVRDLTEEERLDSNKIIR